MTIRSLLFLLLFNSVTSLAQTPMTQSSETIYRIKNWNYEQGLFYGRTSCFLKDINGFLWVGTYKGLNRFDGTSFKNYQKSQDGQAGIVSNMILSLVEDSLHNIWIGTDHGLSRYDIKEDSFMNFVPGTATRIETAGIIPYWATRDEVFCVESDSIFTSYNIHSLQKKIGTSLSKKIENNGAVALSVYEAETNSVWMLPASGGLFARSGMLQVSLSTGKIKNFDWPCLRRDHDHSHWTEGICYDRKRNSIWLNTTDGLIRFTLDDKQYHKIKAVPVTDYRGIGIQMDQQNRVWICTEKKSIMVYDPLTDSVGLPFAGDSALNTKVTNFNYRMYCDQEGIIWIGYWPGFSLGINQLIPTTRSVIQYPGDTHKPHALSTSRGGDMTSAGNNVWIFAGDGLNVFDPSTGLFDFFPNENVLVNGKKKNISFLTVSRTLQKALVAFNDSGGLFEFDLTTRQYSPIILKDLANQTMENIHIADGAFPLNKDEIFFTNEGKHLLFVLHKDSSTAHLLVDFHEKRIVNMAANGDCLIFLSFKEGGLSQTWDYSNGKLMRIITVLDSVPWNNIVVDPGDRSLWLGVYDELRHYDNSLHLIHRYNQEDGIPPINVWAIIPDNHGNIWFNTELAIAKLNTLTGRITLVSEKDGWKKISYKTSTAVAKDNRGDLYFYGYGAVDRIRPDQFIEKYPGSSIYLKSIEINQKKIPLPTGVNNVKELALSYTENRVSIKTGIIDYFSNGASKIRYKLGDNGIWQYAPANSTIYYEALPIGDYKLIMQASNAAYEFNGPLKILVLKISPPWWRSIWFYAVLVLAFIFSLWAFVRYRSRALKEKNIELEEKVLQRTKELKHSLEDLRETQTQLIQREKMASLGELTAGIAHEIQNPLNFVNNFSEVNGELIEEMDQAFDNGNIADARTIAHDIRNNIEKVIHHGKRADGIVKGMLLHSRASTGQKEPADINALADEYLRLSYHGLRAKDKSFNATIETHLDETIGKINIIPQDIGRVLLNLFNNAFFSVTEKLKQQSGNTLSGTVNGKVPSLVSQYNPIVSVSTKRSGSSIEVKVRDNGIGIPQRIIEKIYQPFFTTKPTGEGTGLGLSLSYDIITKAHGGELKVDTQDGEFAEFSILLPL